MRCIHIKLDVCVWCGLQVLPPSFPFRVSCCCCCGAPGCAAQQAEEDSPGQMTDWGALPSAHVTVLPVCSSGRSAGSSPHSWLNAGGDAASLMGRLLWGRVLVVLHSQPHSGSSSDSAAQQVAHHLRQVLELPAPQEVPGSINLSCTMLPCSC